MQMLLRNALFEWDHLGKAIERFFKLQMLPSLAGQIHPLALEPLNGWFTKQVFGLHLSNEGDVSAFQTI